MVQKIKSVSELHKLKPAQQKVAKQQAMSFAEETIKEIFGQCILPYIPDDITAKLIASGKMLSDNGNIKYYENLESLVIMVDIILQNRNVSKIPKTYTSGLNAGDPTNYLYWNYVDPAFFDIHSLIKYCISMIADEYYIENKKIYPTRNQKIISAIKKLNNDDLNEILQSASVSSDCKVHLANLSKFLEKHRNNLKGKIGQKQVDAFFEFVNNAGIRHGKGEQRNPTQAELEIFFDFGLSLARMVF